MKKFLHFLDLASFILGLTAISTNIFAATVIEFYNTNLDNYFITADASEAAAIDGGSAGAGWSRTGNTFLSGGNVSVCRFYGSQSPGPNSHFYTADGGECTGLKQLQATTPATQKRWNFESMDFQAMLPTMSGIDGTCPTGSVPVYRAYNNGWARGIDSNHRITSSLTAIHEVVARGWHDEGVVMCAPSSQGTSRSIPAGFLDVNTVSGVFPNDSLKDSSDGIQTAMNQAKAANQTLYFPSNTTYYVSKTLLGVQPYSGATCGDTSGSSFRLWGGGRGADRPTIVLKDNSPSFNTGTATNLIWIGKDGNNTGVPNSSGASCAFGHVFKNINLVLGTNPWAVGISMNVAQRGALEDVRIDATGAYAGISGVPGRSTAVGNIEIVGGQYGINFIDFPVGISLYGLKLSGQTQRAIAGFAARSFTIVGFEIDKASGPAIETAGANNESGHLGLYDGIIKLATPGTAILNSTQRILDIRNVYLNQASTLFDHGAGGTVAGDSTHWVTVNEYIFCPVSIGGGKACSNLVDGVKDNTAHANLTIPSSAPPSTLVSQHIWEGSLPILNTQVVYITDAPFNAIPNDGLDDHAAIQAAIDSTERGGANAGKSVFVPPGTYDLSGPIILKAHTHLFGIPYGQSEFHAMDAWTDGLSSKAWVMETVDDAAATTSVEYVWTTWKELFKSPGPWMSTMRWRAGKNSVMRGVRGQKIGPRCEDKPRQMWRVESNGGGRWYTWMEEPAQSLGCNTNTSGEMDPNFRKLYITGTTQPLTIYGPNPEHGGGFTVGKPANPFIEIVNSSNIRFFGLKSETNGTMIVISNSNNIFFSGVNAFKFGDYGQPYVQVNNSTNIELALVAAWGSDTFLLLGEAGMGASDVVNHDAEIGIYRRGTINWSAWPSSFNRDGQ